MKSLLSKFGASLSDAMTGALRGKFGTMVPEGVADVARLQEPFSNLRVLANPAKSKSGTAHWY